MEEIEQTESKIADLQVYLKGIRNALKEEEDKEMVKSIRGMNLDRKDLHALLNGLRDGNVTFSSLRQVYSYGYILKKEKMLQEFLKEHRGQNILLVIPEKSPKKQIQEYWSLWCLQHFIKGRLRILFPSEYYGWQAEQSDITVISGWFNRTVMRKIIYGFNTSTYTVLLYDYENRWKNYASNSWKKALDNSDNNCIIEKSLSTEKKPVSTIEYNSGKLSSSEQESSDELGEIRENLEEK